MDLYFCISHFQKTFEANQTEKYFCGEHSDYKLITDRRIIKVLFEHKSLIGSDRLGSELLDELKDAPLTSLFLIFGALSYDSYDS